MTRRLFLGFALGGVLLGGCRDDCSNRMLYSSLSPGSELRVLVYTRSCDSARQSLEINIATPGAPDPGGRGNILSSAAFPVGSPDSLPRLRLEWRGRNRLVVHYPATLALARQKDLVAAVHVSYVADAAR